MFSTQKQSLLFELFQTLGDGGVLLGESPLEPAHPGVLVLAHVDGDGVGGRGVEGQGRQPFLQGVRRGSLTLLPVLSGLVAGAAHVLGAFLALITDLKLEAA